MLKDIAKNSVIYNKESIEDNTKPWIIYRHMIYIVILRYRIGQPVKYSSVYVNGFYCCGQWHP